MKSEDFGVPIQKALPKNHSCDHTQQKENLILEPERITFRKCFLILYLMELKFTRTKQVKPAEKFSKLNKYKTDFCFYDNSFFMEEILSGKN